MKYIPVHTMTVSRKSIMAGYQYFFMYTRLYVQCFICIYMNMTFIVQSNV